MIIADEKFMSEALMLGRKGLGRTSPNPPVGAVIVIDGEIAGRGWHKKAGADHAEIEAINDAKKNGINSFHKATIYVTLEPCCHWGKRPPCAQRIAEESFIRVVIGAIDPNPCVEGRGIDILRNKGIEITTGILETQACRLIEHFATYITKNRAYLAIKWAQSIDGKIAAADGSSRWLSSEESLRFAHMLRDTHDAVIIGAGTLRKDNPQLTVRNIEGRNPVRVIIGGMRKLRCDYNIFNDNKARTILVTSHISPWIDCEPEGDIEIWHFENNGRPTIGWVLRKLAENDLISAIMEGGSTLLGQAVTENVADRLYVIITPKIIGRSGITAISAELASTISQAKKLINVETKRMGDDILITGIFEDKIKRGKLRIVHR